MANSNNNSNEGSPNHSRNLDPQATRGFYRRSDRANRPHHQRQERPANNFRHNQGAQPSHTRTKRPTAKISQRVNDIYVTNKSDFRAQLKQCNTLLSTSDYHEIFLHAIGAAIPRAINLALTLCEESQGGLGYEANTSTITLTDNLHPLHDDGDYSAEQRFNSCLHVRVYRHCRDVLLDDCTGEAAGGE